MSLLTHIAMSSASQLHFFLLLAQFHRPKLFLDLFALFSYLILASLSIVHIAPFELAFLEAPSFFLKSPNDSKSVDCCGVALRNE